jgi:flagellar hook-length control protein FliK
VRWLVGQNIGTAQIRLNPAELGPVELRVNVSGDQVSVAFNSQFGVVREAIEAALPKLREMLESQGLNLAEADINQGDTADNQNGQDANVANDDRLALDGSLDGADPAVSNIAANVVELSSSNFVDQFV